MKIDYSNSGIKTLRIGSTALLLCGVLSAGALIPFWVSPINRGGDLAPNFSMIAASLACLASGVFFLGAGLSLATIAECALYQKRKEEDPESDEE